MFVAVDIISILSVCSCTAGWQLKLFCNLQTMACDERSASNARPALSASSDEHTHTRTYNRTQSSACKLADRQADKRATEQTSKHADTQTDRQAHKQT